VVDSLTNTVEVVDLGVDDVDEVVGWRTGGVAPLSVPVDVVVVVDVDVGVEVSVDVADVVVGRVGVTIGRGAAPTAGSPEICGKGARFLMTRFMWRMAWSRC